MNNLKIGLIIFLFCCNCSLPKYGVIPTNKYIIPYSNMPFGNAREWFGADWEQYVVDYFTPTLEETIIADSIIYKTIDSIAEPWNQSVIAISKKSLITTKNLNKYIRQYSGSNNNGTKEINVSFISSDIAMRYSTEQLKKPILVADGGSNFWSITVNLKTKNAYGFHVNGIAFYDYRGRERLRCERDYYSNASSAATQDPLAEKYIPYFRNYYTTSAFYLLRIKE